jgi:hypothetical protein
VTNKEIDDDFVEKIKRLDDKLLIFLQDVLPESTAVEEIVPEMRKTLAKVCSKIYTHILNSFMIISKPNTSVQIVRDNIFMKNIVLISFIKKHAVAMYKELLSKYVILMEKIYITSTTKHIQELTKYIYIYIR